MRAIIVIITASLLAGCASMPPLACAGDQQPTQIVEMLFGRNIGDHVGVSEAQFRAFVDREMTPRFADGLTIVDAKGQWRASGRHRIVREPTKLVIIALPRGAPDNQAKIDAVVRVYKTQFHQQGVGVFMRTDCVTFSVDQ